jgi:fucose permease
MGCLVSYVIIALPIGRKLVRQGLTTMSLPMEIALVQVAYFGGCLVGALTSMIFLDKLNRKYTTIFLLFLCACATSAFGAWRDIVAIIG